MTGTIGCTAQGFGEEEVLHVDYDKGCFLGVDGNGCCGCLEAEAGNYSRRIWARWMGEVETVTGAV